MRLYVLAIMLALPGCYNPYVIRPGGLAPATAMIPAAERGAVWQRSVGVLLEEGYVPQVLNEAACDEVDYGALAGTMAIVTIAPDGVVRVEVSGGGLYQSLDDVAADVSKRQIHLLRRILNQPEPSAPPGAARPS